MRPREGLAHGQLIKACPACSEFHLPCYCLAKFGDPFTPRHNFRIIFTDGACLNNGQHDATSGVGIAFGPRPNRQWFVPISDEEDPYHIRSNQRAELYAALSGLRCRADLAKTEDQASGSTTSDYGGTGRAHCASASSKRTKDLVSKEPWIIATDSEYVVKGMTEWLPAWKVNDFRTSKGTPVANLDLFLLFDAEMTRHERSGIEIGLWHVPREYNTIADGLAKKAAALGSKATKKEI